MKKFLFSLRAFFKEPTKTRKRFEAPTTIGLFWLFVWGFDFVRRICATVTWARVPVRCDSLTQSSLFIVLSQDNELIGRDEKFIHWDRWFPTLRLQVKLGKPFYIYIGTFVFKWRARRVRYSQDVSHYLFDRNTCCHDVDDPFIQGVCPGEPGDLHLT